MKRDMRDVIYRQDVIDALWKALYEYEDKTEKQFQESDELDVGDWIVHRIFVQNMSDIDRQTILNLPSAQQWIPVTLETLPNLNSVVVVCGKKGTWDYGTYRGWHGNIHSWNWKKNTNKDVYWWMYKADALPKPWEGEQDWRDS